jgi:hypothetical protein
MKGEKAAAFRYLDSANANGYLNTYEMENFDDFDNIRDDERFKKIYAAVYNRAFSCRTVPEARCI